MIEIKNISNSFKYYENQNIILWGAGKLGKKTLDVLEYLGVNVIAFCDNNPSVWGSLIKNIEVISPKDLEIFAKDNKAVIQISFLQKDYSDLLNQIEKIGVKKYISFKETNKILMIHKHLFELENSIVDETYENSKFYVDLLDLEEILNKKLEFIEYIKNGKEKDSIFICSPFSSSIDEIYSLVDMQKELFDFNCSPLSFDKEVLKYCNTKIKLILEVQKPVNQNINAVNNIFKKKDVLSVIGYLKFKNNSVQNCFNCLLKTEVQNQSDKFIQRYFSIQKFMDSFCKHIIDITQYPFDKDKGYTIINTNNIELFVYQKEKINCLLPKIANWISVDKKLLKINKNKEEDTENVNIRFSDKYLSKCYNEIYINHFYEEYNAK